MLVVPRHLSRIDVDRQGGAAEKGIIIDGHSAAYRHPGFRLRSSPESEIEIRVITSGDPTLRTCTEEIRQLAPGIATRLAVTRDGVHAPQFLADRDVVRADKTFFLAVS